MNNTRDDYETVEQAYERVKRKPHREWNDYDRDDIASFHMIEGLRSVADEWKKTGKAAYAPAFRPQALARRDAA